MKEEINLSLENFQIPRKNCLITEGSKDWSSIWWPKIFSYSFSQLCIFWGRTLGNSNMQQNSHDMVKSSEMSHSDINRNLNFWDSFKIRIVSNCILIHIGTCV